MQKILKVLMNLPIQKKNLVEKVSKSKDNKSKKDNNNNNKI